MNKVELVRLDHETLERLDYLDQKLYEFLKLKQQSVATVTKGDKLEYC